MTERTKQTQLLKSSFREFMKGVCTSVPGHILAFDPVTQLAQIQVGILRIDLNGGEFALKPIIEVPVLFPGGEWCVEYQIDPGNEGWIMFSQRCIDGWLQNGGVAQNPIGRFHNLQDAAFIPGFRPAPSVLPDFQNNGIRLRSQSGGQFAWLKNDGSIALENGAGHIRLGADGVVTINGVTIDPASLVTTPNDVLASTISLKTHVHGGVTPGGGSTAVPTP